jgi:OPA family sugar phosphate sensor protein UhpC-like MFS transporter
MIQALSPQLKLWRYRIFASTWLCYAGFYFARKPFSIVKKDLGDALGWSAYDLGLIGSVYLIAYAIGQFIAGSMGTKYGARRLLIAGMAASVLANVVFGMTNSVFTFCVFMAVNGLGQATGWSGTVATMAAWLRRPERGTVMGVWGTCFSVGGTLANILAAYLLGAYGYQYSFFGGSLILTVAIVFFVFNQRNRPEDVGLKLDDPDVEAAEQSDEPENLVDTRGWLDRVGWSRSTLNTVLLIGSFYFFVKFIRYALWSWVPYFLSTNYGLRGDDAGYISTLFDLFGIAGCIVCGIISDRMMSGRRAKISFIFLLALCASTVFMFVTAQVSLTFFAISISAVGFSLYGPDALMTGAAAQDIGGRGTAMAAGLINGMGSIGAVVQEIAIGKMFDSSGGDLGPVFGLLVGASVGAVVLLSVVLWRNHRGISDV